MNSFGPQADIIIARLKAVDRTHPIIDCPRIEQAVIEHFHALEITPWPMRWVVDAEIGYSAARSAAESAAWSAAESAAESAAWSAAESAARSATWSENAAWIESATWSKDKKHWNNVWLPFVDAYEAGLWLFWVLNQEILLVPRPTMHIVGQQLHRDDGPAVWWPNGAQYFFLHGVLVPAAVVLTDSDQLEASLILTERNAEVRREIVRKIGIERVCTNLHAKVLDREGTYELLILELKDGRQQPWLKMKNPSIGVYHIEGVHPHCRTVKEALKWRNRVEASPSILT